MSLVEAQQTLKFRIFLQSKSFFFVQLISQPRRQKNDKRKTRNKNPNGQKTDNNTVECQSLTFNDFTSLLHSYST